MIDVSCLMWNRCGLIERRWLTHAYVEWSPGLERLLVIPATSHPCYTLPVAGLTFAVALLPQWSSHSIYRHAPFPLSLSIWGRWNRIRKVACAPHRPLGVWIMAVHSVSVMGKPLDARHLRPQWLIFFLFFCQHPPTSTYWKKKLLCVFLGVGSLFSQIWSSSMSITHFNIYIFFTFFSYVFWWIFSFSSFV